MSVRDAHGTATRTFKWTCSIIMAFNANNMPKVPLDDGALASRMIAIQHRSKFVQGEVDASQPHTFPAVTGIEKKYAPPTIMHWLVAGLKKYLEAGAIVVPTICNEWRGGLYNDQDDFAKWATEHISASPSGLLLTADAKRSFMSDTGISLTTAACNKKLKAFLTAKGTHFTFEASKRVGAALCSSVFVGIVADS